LAPGEGIGADIPLSARLPDPWNAMKSTLLKLCILLILLGLISLPARAQLRAIPNERGNLVFVNDPPASATPKPEKNSLKQAVSPQAAIAPAPSAPSVNPHPSPTTPQEIDQIVQTTAEKHRVDPRLVRAVIATESNWNAGAVSRKGAQGLMQLNPQTAQTLGVADAFDPAQNVDGGVRYLGMMLDRYNGDVHKALAAYNAGPGAVDRVGGIPRIPETRNYVQKVTSAYIGGTGLRPRAVAAPIEIYRVVEADGRVVFRNE
jgi:soluble lytic murein transglycosylase-like protein